MILVHGQESALRTKVLAHLKRHGYTAQAADLDAHLFTLATERKATHVVGLASNLDAEQRVEQVRALTAASTSPSAPIVVLVTTADSDAPEITALKRHGAPYQVLRTRELWDEQAAALLKQRPIWLSRQAANRCSDIQLEDSWLRALEAAMREDARVGVELDACTESWRFMLARAQAHVREVPNWAARAWASMGGRAVWVRPDGQIESTLAELRQGDSRQGSLVIRSAELARVAAAWRVLCARNRRPYDSTTSKRAG